MCLERKNRGRTFYLYPDAPSFIDDVRGTIHQNTWHEYMLPDRPVKMYFDLDDKDKTPGWDDLIERLKGCIVNGLGYTPEFLMEDASSESKHSMHLKCPDAWFDRPASLSVFARTVHTQLDRDKRIDMHVYTESSTACKCLRMMYCPSYGKTNILKPRGGPAEFNVEWFMRSMLTQGECVNPIRLAIPDRVYTPHEFEEDVDPVHARALDNIERVIRTTWCLSHVDSKQRLDARTGVWVWHVRPGLWCPIKKRRHAHNNAMIRGTLVGEAYVKLETFCLDDECRQWTENRDHDWTRIAFM